MSTHEPRPVQTAGLREYLSVLWLRKWSIAAIAALTLGSALFVSFHETPQYQSTSKILVKPINNPLQSNTADSLVSLDTEQQIAASDKVATLAASNMSGNPSTQSLLDHVSVSSPSNTQVLEISFTDPSPLRAQEGAAAFSSAYIDYKTREAKATVEGMSQPLTARIKDLTTQLRQLDEEIAASGGVATPEQQSQREVLTSHIAVIRSQLDPLRTILFDPGDVIKSAELPTSPVSPDHVLNGGLGLFVGLGLGVGIAFLRERLDDRLRGREDLSALSSSVVLAVIPKVSGWRRRGEAKLVTAQQPKSAAAEAYRTLRTGVLFVARQRGTKTILVTSPSAGEGKTTTAANLAVVLADSGKRVILVSGDVRKPRLHRFFKIENRSGMVNVLAGEATLLEALVDPSVENLRLLPSGPVPAGPSELMGSDAMEALIEELSGLAEFVLIDTPPLFSVSDALTIAPLVDGVILVVDAQSTTRGSLTHAHQQLDQMGVHLLGSVLNNFDPSKARGYSQYSYDYVYVDARNGREPSRRKASPRVPPEELPQPRISGT